MGQSLKPNPNDSVGRWQAWLTQAAASGDAAEVRRRLAEVPDAIRDQVRDHARTVWKLAEKDKLKKPFADY